MSNNFGKFITKIQQTQSLANFLPNGLLFVAKNFPSAVFRKLLTGLASEIFNVQQKIVEIMSNRNINNAVGLIDEWEGAVGIPSKCFTNTVSLEERRNQVRAKILANGVQTADDFIAVAKLLGYVVTITPAMLSDDFPLSFPATFSYNAEEGRFTMFVDFDQNVDKFIFPLPFPVKFSSGNSNVIECLFNKLKPANVLIIYRYIN